MKRLYIALAVFLLITAAAVSFFASFPRPYRAVVEESGLEPALVYAVMKAESGFDERAISPAGAKGVMQLMPSTAAFIAELENIPFDEKRLFEGEYNVRLGCAYLKYLLERFEERTALAAYNAGEGTVRRWHSDPALVGADGELAHIPYPETRSYVRKTKNFYFCYKFFYG